MKRDRIVYGDAIRKAQLLRAKRRRMWLGDKLHHPDDEQDMPRAETTTAAKNKSYVVPCTSAFRDAVQDLADRRGVNAGELARAVLLLMPVEASMFRDPGEPDVDDRETVVLKSGTNAGKNWRRKPRLQVRTLAGRDPAEIRRALALALAIDRGDFALRLEEGGGPSSREQLGIAQAENTRLRRQIGMLLFEPLAQGVRNRAEALYVLGFSPGSRPNPEAVRKRYRALAAVHHPDSSHGEHRRMSQLNEAVQILRGKS